MNDQLDERSPQRIADNAAHEAWLCAKLGIDPDNIDGKMSVTDLEARCEGDTKAVVKIIEMHGRQS